MTGSNLHYQGILEAVSRTGMEIKNTGRGEVNLRKKDRLLSERSLFLKGSAALGKQNQALHKRSAEA